jgi:hypothetical protein
MNDVCNSLCAIYCRFPTECLRVLLHILAGGPVSSERPSQSLNLCSLEVGDRTKNFGNVHLNLGPWRIAAKAKRIPFPRLSSFARFTSLLTFRDWPKAKISRLFFAHGHRDSCQHCCFQCEIRERWPFSGNVYTLRFLDKLLSFQLDGMRLNGSNGDRVLINSTFFIDFIQLCYNRMQSLKADSG